MKDDRGLISAMVPAAARVLRRQVEYDEVVTLEVERPATLTKEFLPGQFNMLYVFGVGEIAVSHSGHPFHQDRIVHTIRAVGKVSRALILLKPGDWLGIRGPYGTPWPIDHAKGQNLIVVAGGLGLAPLRPVLYEVSSAKDAYRSMRLIYGTRDPSSILYQSQFEGGPWAEFGQVTVDSANLDWQGNVGVVTDLISADTLDTENAVALICGPEVMMRFSANALIDLGMREDRIYVSLERNMKCAVKQCGRCQFGPYFVCRDGPVASFGQVDKLLKIAEL